MTQAFLVGGLEGFAGRARPSDDSSHPDTSSVRAHRPVAAPSLRHAPTRAIYGIFDQPKEPVRQEYLIIVCDLSGHTIRIFCLLERGYSDAELPVMLLSQMVQESKEYSTVRPSYKVLAMM